MRADLGIATCRQLPEPDPDEALLLRALEARGVRAAMVAWDAPLGGPAPPVVVVRSTWNYHHRPADFLAWADGLARAGVQVHNPPAVMRWNADKRYLLELQAAGVQVVETEFIARGAACDLGGLLEQRGWERVVVKPAVSAGSFGTLEGGAELQGALDSMLGERDMTVQPYMEQVEAHGERSIVFIAGEPTHEVRKSPRFAGNDESVSDAHEPGDGLPLARATLAAARHLTGEDVLYARVDVVPDPAAGWRVMELELIEPSLFLAQHPPALDRFANALAALVP